MMGVVAGISIIFSIATDADITGIDIFEMRDSITFDSLSRVSSPQNSKRMPLNQAFVLYKPFFRASNK